MSPNIWQDGEKESSFIIGFYKSLIAKNSKTFAGIFITDNH